MTNEVRLIDANEYFERLQMVRRSSKLLDRNGVLNLAEIALEAAPTVDAVEVVRCKDCKYAKNMAPIGESKYMIGECFLREEDEIEFMVYDDDFCSYGERKEA